MVNREQQRADKKALKKRLRIGRLVDNLRRKTVKTLTGKEVTRERAFEKPRLERKAVCMATGINMKQYRKLAKRHRPKKHYIRGMVHTKQG